MLTFPKRLERYSRARRLTGAAGERSLNTALPGIRLTAVGGTVGARVASLLLGCFAAIVVARGLHPHGRAVLAVMIAVPGIFSVFGVLGLDNANARFSGTSHSAFRQVVRLAMAFSAVAGSALAAAWWFAGSVWPALRLGLDPRLAIAAATVCPVSLLLTLLGAAEIGRGRVAVYNAVTAATTAAYVVGVLTLAATGHLTVMACFVCCAAGQSLGVILFLALAAVRVHPDGSKIALRRYLGYALRAYLPNVAHYGMLRMDVPVIQLLAGTAAVALYAVALPVAEALLLLPAAVAVVMFPRVTCGAIDREAADRIGGAVVVSTALLAVAVAVSAPVIIPAVYGAPYRGTVAVVWCMLPGLVIFSAGRTSQAYLAATDRLRPVIIATVAGAAAGLACLVELTPRLGAAGAGAADSIGYVAFTAVLSAGLSQGRLVSRLVMGPLRYGGRITWLAAGTAAAAVRRWKRSVGVGCAAAAIALIAAKVSVLSPATAAAAVGTVILLATLTAPSVGIYTLAIAIPVSQTSFGARLVTQRDLLLLVLACVAAKAAAGRVTRPKAWPMVLAACLVGYVLLSTLLVGGEQNGTDAWRALLLLSVPMLCLPLIAGPDEITRRALTLFGYATACFAVAEAVTARASLAAQSGISAADSALVAAGQTGAVNHNAEGALFVLALGVLLARFAGTRHAATKLALAAAVGALAIGVAYSFSRSSYFGALALIAVFAGRRSVRGVIAAAIGVGCLMPLLPAAVTARFDTVWSSSGLDVSSALRLDLWGSALRMFAAHPAVGVGYLKFAPQLPDFFDNSGRYATSVVQFPLLEFAHNTYLSVLAETGAVGALLVGTLIVAGWRRAWSAARAGDWAGEAAVLGFAGVGVCSAFGEVLLVLPILAGFVLVVLAAARSGEVARDRIARGVPAVSV